MEYHVSFEHYHGKTIAVTMVTCSLKAAVREAQRLIKERWVAKIVIFDPKTVKTD
jgi:uncharacterized membrane protein YoaK (UPF0700 family)